MRRDIVIKEIERIITEENSKIILYPYGKNALTIEELLEKVFSIVPLYKVDNVLCNYKKDIISIEELKKVYRKDEYIFLTAENIYLNESMERELLTFVPKERIVNVIKNTNVSLNINYKLFSLKELLPVKFKNAKNNEKIKIRFISGAYYFFNCINSIVQAFLCDSRFDVKVLIYGYDSEKQAILVENIGAEFCFADKYCAADDNPDIIVVTYINCRNKLPEEFLKMREYAKLTFCATQFLIRAGEFSINQFLQGGEVIGRIEKTFSPDYYFFDRMLYKEIKESGLGSDRIIEMGNAKFDGIYNTVSAGIKNCFKKLKDKKIFLWIMDHGVNGNQPTANLTFDIYLKPLLEYAQLNQEIGLILRMHPSIEIDLKEAGIWSDFEMDLIRKYITSTNNVVLDENDTYNESLAEADAFIIDAYCGAIVTALPLNKPTCLLYRDDFPMVSLHKELDDCYYAASSKETLFSFIDDIVNGKDSLKENRQIAISNCITEFDGKNGVKIKDFITQKYNELNLFEKRWQ